MDEVDKIIIQSLRQIDAVIDDETTTLNNFTPELVARAVSTCLQEINPNSTLPRILPIAIAQRFTVATILAEACTGAGYRNNIGYQTFLYPNVVEIRRLFMFLIEQLPRVPSTLIDFSQQSPLKEFEILKKDVKNKILNQLKTPWVPQFCRSIANKNPYSCSSLIIDFSPQLNLNIPMKDNLPKEMQYYFQQISPNVFQQTALEKYDLISSVLHKNSIDIHRNEKDMENFKLTPAASTVSRNRLTRRSLPPTSDKEQGNNLKTSKEEEKTITLLDQLSSEVNFLQLECEEQSKKRKSLTAQLITLKEKQPTLEDKLNELMNELKVNERICVILENPEENIAKLEALVKSTEDKKHILEEQWRTYRKPLETHFETLQNIRSAKNTQSIKDMKEFINKLEEELREKTAIHMQLNSELKNAQLNTAPRKEYTRRIHEFISNIRKQRNDIYKVLNDTRDLQKQINSVSGQLQRQFNYTDDLLFQSAKHDLHAKKAYKLLATLHSNCTELVELVSQTGNITKEIRDLEVQIDNERLKNIPNTLEQITNDIKKFENLYRDLQSEKYSIENEITVNLP